MGNFWTQKHVDNCPGDVAIENGGLKLQEAVEVSGDPILWKSSSTNPGASIKVKFDDLELLKAEDI